MINSIKYSCLVDGYTTRSLLSDSTILLMQKDMLSVVSAIEVMIKSKPLLTIETSNHIISKLNNIFYFYTAFLAKFESFTEQDRIKSDFRDQNIQSKIKILKERLGMDNK